MVYLIVWSRFPVLAATVHPENQNLVSSGVLNGFVFSIGMQVAYRVMFLNPYRCFYSTQETHWRFSSEWSTHAFYCIHTGCSQKSVGGCLTMISHRLCSAGQLRFQEIVSGRLLHVCFPGHGTTVHIINLYQHFLSRQWSWWARCGGRSPGSTSRCLAQVGPASRFFCT